MKNERKGLLSCPRSLGQVQKKRISGGGDRNVAPGMSAELGGGASF